MHVCLSLSVSHVILLLIILAIHFLSIHRRPGLYKMAQYQQWLQYQEIHKRLSTQVEALEAELAKLQDCLDRLGQQHEFVSFTDNPIMQALVTYLPSQSVPPISNAKYTPGTNNPSETSSDES